MPQEYRDVIIGPLGYETDPVKIRAAFSLGCSAVIIDGFLPENVRSELELISSQQYPQLESQQLRKRKDVLAWEKPDDRLCLTQHWLAAQAQQAEESGLRPRQKHTSFVFDSTAVMSLWPQRSAHYGWHIDESDLWPYPDLHIHLCGAGLVVAAPEKNTATVPLQGRIFSVAHPSEVDSDVVEVADVALQNMGLKLVPLQPGQTLAFMNTCLHRSSRRAEDVFKLRAAMF